MSQSKKRKRSPSDVSQVTQRKKRKLNAELDEQQAGGASFLRYEIIEKKG
jgi:hypothetical protein